MARLSALAALLAVFALTACDQQETKSGPHAAFDAGDPRNAPEPARFGRKEEPAWLADPEPAASPAAAALKTAAGAPTLSPEEDPGRELFDGARVQTASSIPPRPAAQSDSYAGKPVTLANRKMSIDTDGLIADPAQARRLRRDPWRQNDTSLHYADGRPLDPAKIPYIVLPLGYRGAELGDLALVEYKGRKVWAVCGDRGPAGRFGEASTAAAEALGVSGDGVSGGVAGGVTYTLFPGSGGGRPRNQQELLVSIAARSPVLYARLNHPASIQLASL